MLIKLMIFALFMHHINRENKYLFKYYTGMCTLFSHETKIQVQTEHLINMFKYDLFWDFTHSFNQCEHE